MVEYIIKRLILAFFTLLAILLVSYVLLRLAPGDPTRSSMFGSDAAGSRSEPAGKGAQQPALRHSLFHALRHGIAKAQKRHGGAAARKLHHRLPESKAPQHHAQHHIGAEDPGGGQAGAVDEHLAQGADGPAHQKSLQQHHAIASNRIR